LKRLAPLTVVTVVGAVTVERRYFACSGCGQTHAPWDQWAGVDKHRLSAGARRMACLTATSWSFDQASTNLRALCGLDISDESIRRVCAAEGARARTWLGTPAAAEPVRSAEGHAECLVDGAAFNTRVHGWREMRVMIQSKRAAGQKIDPAKWSGLADRRLPKPVAALVSARAVECEEVGNLLGRAAERVGMARGYEASVIADGAKWIWAQVDRVLPKAERVVDVYHVSQHLHECGQAVYGPKTAEAREWAERRLAQIVREGPSVCLWHVERQAEACASPGAKKALISLADYLRPNLAALRYGDRLRRGLTIGSGQVESACKTIVGRRLKINSARWHVPMAEGMASLCAITHAKLWESFWGLAAA